jgi:hypothetical protein
VNAALSAHYKITDQLAIRKDHRIDIDPLAAYLSR